MTFISLRKHAPGPEPDEDMEETEETPDDEEHPPAKPEKQVGALGALLIGICGPAQRIAGRFGTGAAWGVHGVALWAVGYYGGWVAVGVILTWLLLVGLFTPPEALDRLSAWVEQLGERRHQRHGEDAAEAGGEPPHNEPATPGQGLARWLLDTIEEQPGIHVRDLYPAMRELPGQEGRSDADLKALLQTFGVPVHRSLRIGRIAGRSGVRRADVEALLSPTGERRVDSVVNAGQGVDSPLLSGPGEGA